MNDETFELDDPEGWARFPCGNCGKQLKVGDVVRMAPINPLQSHPEHVDRRKCKPSAR